MDPRVEKLKQDALFRHKGWIKGQMGPSFNDVLHISGVGLETGSWIVTTFFIGYTVGSLLSAVLYEKMNREFLFFSCQFVLVGMLLIIPWCFNLTLMVVAHFIKGMAEGVIDPVSNTEIVRLWGEKAKVYIIGLNISLSIGSIVSPLLTEPFLVELKDNSPSQLYKAYSITAAFSFCVAVSFLILYSTAPTTESSPNLESTERETDKAVNELPKKYVMFALPVMGAMLFFFNAIDEAYVSYLPTFCIEHLKWTKSQAAYITSVMFILVFVSRIISMFMIKCVETIQVVGLQCLLMFFSFIGLLISASIKFEPGIWISGPMVGYSKSVIFGLIFAWTNEYFVQVTGKVSSAFFVIAMVGSSINPVAIISSTRTLHYVDYTRTLHYVDYTRTLHYVDYTRTLHYVDYTRTLHYVDYTRTLHYVDYTQILHYVDYTRTLHYVDSTRTLHYVDSTRTLHYVDYTRTLHYVDYTQILHYVDYTRTLHYVDSTRTLHYVDSTRTLHYVDPTRTLHYVDSTRTLHYVESTRTLHYVDSTRTLHYVDSTQTLHNVDSTRNLHYVDSTRTLHYVDSTRTLHYVDYTRTLHYVDSTRTLHYVDSTRTLHYVDSTRNLHYVDSTRTLHYVDSTRTLHYVDYTRTLHYVDYTRTLHYVDYTRTLHYVDSTRTLHYVDNQYIVYDNAIFNY